MYISCIPKTNTPLYANYILIKLEKKGIPWKLFENISALLVGKG